MTDDLTVLNWNAHANHPSQAGRVTKQLDAWPDWDVAALTEVKGCYGALQWWAKRNGCHLEQEKPQGGPADERGDTALLIRGIKVKRTWVARMREAWTVFSHRVRHKPRRHQRGVILHGGRRVRVSAEHWPTRGNQRAWAESYRAAERFLNRKGLGIVVGDLNAEKNDVYGLKDDVGGKFAGRRPDWLITNQPARIEVRELGKGGSDHVALLFTVKV